MKRRSYAIPGKYAMYFDNLTEAPLPHWLNTGCRNFDTTMMTNF